MKRLAMTTVVAFALSGAPTAFAQDASNGLTVSASEGTMQQLLDGKYAVTVRCPGEGCNSVGGRVTVTPDDMRRLAIPSWRKSQVIGSFEDSGGDTETRVYGGLEAGSYIQQSLGFPIFGKVPITISAHAEWAAPTPDNPDATASGDAVTASTLRWPKAAPEHGGRGRAIIKRIRGPRKVSLRAKSATFKIRVAPFKGSRYFAGTIYTAGRLLSPSQDNGLPAWVGHRSGTFGLKLSIARTSDKKGLKEAKSVAPLAAKLSIGFLNKSTNRDEQAVHYFTLTK